MNVEQRNLNGVCSVIVLLMAVLCLSQSASAWEFNVDPISDNNYMDISTSNGGGYYVGFRCAGGGLNALHITTSTSDPYGQVSSVSSDSGSFYLADTGGRGYFDRTILMVAVKVPEDGEEVSEDLKIHLKASGYRWVSEGLKDQPPDETNITYVTGSIDRDFGLSSVTYGPQSWKPAGEADHSIMAGQSSSDEFYIFFVDTGVGILGGNSGITGLTDNGMAKIDYTIEDYNGETIVFNVYGYALWADAVKDGIAWTNKIDGTKTDKNARTGANGYIVQLETSGGDSEFGNSTAIDYGGSDSNGFSGSDTGRWAPPVGNLNITSDPVGAKVYLDNVDAGRVTNASFVDFPEGEYSIRLELPGYDPLERTGISVKKGYVTSRHFNLTPAKGSCTVLSDLRGAKILIDGDETLCYANWTFDDIEVGRHMISLQKDGYAPVSREVVIDETNVTVVSFEMSGGREEGVDLRGEGDTSSVTTVSSAETLPVKEVPDEGSGLLDLLLSMIAGIFGGGDAVSHVGEGTSGYIDGSADDDIPVPETVAGVPEDDVERDVGDGEASGAVRTAQVGSVYVLSYPSGSTISVDGRDTGYTTPHLVYGLKSGVHTVTVKAHRMAPVSQSVVVPAGDSTVAEFNVEDAGSRKVSVSVTSKALRGGNFSVNGEPPSVALPSRVMVGSSGSYLTYHDGEHYYSRNLPLLNGGESFVLEKTDTFGKINVTSVPEGAGIYLDGIKTGHHTPCTIDTVGDGRHKLMVTKAGCLPVKKEVLLVNGGDEIDLAQHFVLENIATGRLVVTSDPSGCMVYLKGVYTGQTTPCTFEAIPIGTYDVGVMLNRTHFKNEDVTVLAADECGDTTVGFDLAKYY